MPLPDELAAARAVAALDAPSSAQLHAAAHVARILHRDSATPFADIHELFRLFDTLYFGDLLLARVQVSWSSRLTLCAGICELVKDSAGSYSRIRLKLSEPLLKFRPRSDTINTLLHEAIHAYLFVTSSWRHSRDDDKSGHGTAFQMLASAINTHGDYDVTIYHTFHDEVGSYRTHVWLCDGPCRTKPPFFGLVKRSMNRAPGKSDSWWSKHEAECGGTFAKLSAPELTKQQISSLSAKERAGRQKNKIDTWVKAAPHSVHSAGKPKRERSEDNDPPKPDQKKAFLACPICDFAVTAQNINNHLDSAHGT